ncbi:MAG: helix-turn-helix domain-containing protein [Aristaeellaceae bacterium]
MSSRHGELWAEIRASHSLRRVLYIVMAVTTVLFVIILSVTVRQMVMQNNVQWQLEADSSLKHAQAINDTNIRGILDYTLQRMDSYEVRGLLYSPEYPVQLKIRARDVYEQLTCVSSLIRNVQLINYQTGTVMDHNGRFSLEGYGDQDILAFLDTLTPSSHTRVYYYPRLMNTKATRTITDERRVISMIFYLNRAGALVVNLDYDLYKSLVLSPENNGPTDYILYNNEGNIYCATDDALFSSSILDHRLYQEIMQQQEDTGSFQIVEGGKVKTVSYIRNLMLGANYVAVTTMEAIYPGTPLFWRVVGLAVLFLLASALISAGLAVLISKPIRTLHRSVKENLSDDMLPEDELDEMTFLSEVYQSILTSNQRLTEDSRVYQMEREGQMLLNLMNPASPSLRPSAAAAAELEAKFAGPLFRVVTLMPDRRHIQMETDAQTIRRTIAATAGESLRSLGMVRTIFPPSFKVIFLVNLEGSGQAALRETLKRALTEARQALGGMPLYMGVGQETAALDEISDSYSGAEEAVQHAYIRQIGEVLYADELSFPDLDEQVYAFEQDEKITRAIRHMEREKAEEAILMFFDRISCYYHNQFVRSTLHLDVALQRMEINLQLERPSSVSRIDTATVMHWNAQDACQYFIHRAQLDIAQLQDMKKSSSSGSELIDRIDRMIDDNIFNPDFSIVQLADAFSFSVNYLRSLYKAGAGESLSAHIARKRVEAACSLLDNTDESIETITQKLGFSTRNYFFTFFKKHMGMTPAQYRNR